MCICMCFSVLMYTMCVQEKDGSSLSFLLNTTPFPVLLFKYIGAVGLAYWTGRLTLQCKQVTRGQNRLSLSSSQTPANPSRGSLGFPEQPRILFEGVLVHRSTWDLKNLALNPAFPSYSEWVSLLTSLGCRFHWKWDGITLLPIV